MMFKPANLGNVINSFFCRIDRKLFESIDDFDIVCKTVVFGSFNCLLKYAHSIRNPTDQTLVQCQSRGAGQKVYTERLENPTKKWKFSPMDLKSRARREEFSQAKDKMIVAADTDECPWWLVEADSKRKARLNCISHLLSLVPYEEIPHEAFELPPRPPAKGYKRPSKGEQHYVPEIF